MQLVIGNKNYSSWSLRPWLLLKEFSISFAEIRISLYAGEFQKVIRKYSQAGKVPVLIDSDILVWDSLAICEYISEKYLSGKGWPNDLNIRAQARSCSAEMHSGFITLRNRMPMNCRATQRSVALTPELQAEIQRIDQLWSELRSRYC
ncbi:MAG: glutathione S-transferase, partial [Pseudohongiellaceae bacterium]